MTPHPKAADTPEKESFLLAILNQSPTPMLAFEPLHDGQGTIDDFRVNFANGAAERMTFMSLADMRKVSLLQTCPSAGPLGLIDRLVHVVKSGEEVRDEIYVDFLDVWIDVSVTPLARGFVATLLDITARKRAEAELEERGRRLQGVLDASMNGIITYVAVRAQSKDGKQGSIVDFQFQTINRAAMNVLGLTENPVGMNMLSLFPSLIAHDFFDQYIDVVETGNPLRFETDYSDGKGAEGWYDVAVAKLDDGFVITFNDMTYLKNAKQVQQQQTELVNSVLDGAINSIIAYEAIRDPASGVICDFKIILANPAAEHYLERLGTELIGQKLLTLYPEELDMGLMARYVNTVETGQPFRTEAFYQDTATWIDLSGSKLGDGLVVTFSDITINKQAALELTQQAEFVSKLLDGSLNGVMSNDPVYDDQGVLIDLRILSANQAAELYLGSSECDLVGKNLLELYPQHIDMGLFAMYERVLRTKQPERMEAYHRADVEVWLDSSATPLDGDGLVISFIDITERKKAQRQADTLIGELRKSNANLEQFAYVASHDLQEPLRKVMAFGDILQKQYSSLLDETGADMIRRMQSAAERMQILIRDLLTFSRVTSNSDEFCPVDLSAVVRDVLTDLDTTVIEKGARAEIDSLPTIKGDALQWRQLFQNLLSNALKFTRAETIPHIRITYTKVNTPEPGFATLVPVDLLTLAYHRIDVSDNGIGFESQYAEQIFQLFQRLHTRSHYTGTGIGLSIVQKVVENHRGYIQAQGRPGEGSVFTILLPIGNV
ncbi:PAS domain-containing sensor histidine kinase [Spirosoma utsteinense]|uniref:PAS domain-containing sensor histidine kinase n=1 Tax=Spirosoma utsteinense TaxID=2585773 RepID=UPI0016465CD1|nr:PAS domain-containing protein [Spirosoma utsteinense]MBC3786392.1 PAS domain S-box-containing protein [Spirosoma utsteinense]